jgi:hypothetical protein
MSIFMLKCPECGADQEKTKRRSQPRKKNKKKIQRKIEKKASAKCKGNKITHKTHGQAAMVAKKLFAEKGRMSKIYRCGFCKGFHLTKSHSK